MAKIIFGQTKKSIQTSLKNTNWMLIKGNSFFLPFMKNIQSVLYYFALFTTPDNKYTNKRFA